MLGILTHPENEISSASITKVNTILWKYGITCFLSILLKNWGHGRIYRF